MPKIKRLSAIGNVLISPREHTGRIGLNRDEKIDSNGLVEWIIFDFGTIGG